MPITAQCTLDALEVPAKKLLLAENNFVSHNRFTVLADTEMGLNELFADLIDTVWDQSAWLGALDTPGETIKTLYTKPYTDKSVQSIPDVPVYDKYKNLISEKLEKIKILTNDFGELAKDTTGNSRCSNKWEKPISTDTD
ncbi:hypothetical protein AYI70_g208 [Smittium culicis]|uniref:Uncharacterized protein n=1 Tax=Smittium culicis TaxID=133412 RepID=A0A1R1YHZ8_9FUNG|nr:hypothetical protein AYI70_g208 [Smittium culicis]